MDIDGLKKDQDALSARCDTINKSVETVDRKVDTHVARIGGAIAIIVLLGLGGALWSNTIGASATQASDIKSLKDETKQQGKDTTALELKLSNLATTVDLFSKAVDKQNAGFAKNITDSNKLIDDNAKVVRELSVAVGKLEKATASLESNHTELLAASKGFAKSTEDLGKTVKQLEDIVRKTTFPAKFQTISLTKFLSERHQRPDNIFKFDLPIEKISGTVIGISAKTKGAIPTKLERATFAISAVVLEDKRIQVTLLSEDGDSLELIRTFFKTEKLTVEIDITVAQ